MSWSGPGGGEGDVLDRVLGLRAGKYAVEQRLLDAAELPAAGAVREAHTMGVPGAAAPIPAGRLSRIAIGSDEFEVQTEAENRPNLTATTLIVRGGKIVRRIESSWQHSYTVREDEPLARRFIDGQHERVLASLRDLGRRKLAEAAGAGAIDLGILAGALSFLSDHAREILGLAMTLVLLRRSRDEVAARRPELGPFKVLATGRVVLDEGTATAAQRSVVDAIAEWTALFMRSAEPTAPRLGARVRESTSVLEGDLERLGFYAALDAARARLATPRGDGA